MSEPPPENQPAVYRIAVRGRLDTHGLPCFDSLAVTCDGEVTTLAGPVADQAALRGLLCWLWNLNMTLLAVTRIDWVPQGTEKGTEPQ